MVSDKKIRAYWGNNPVPTNYQGSGFKDMNEMRKFARQLSASGWKKVKIISKK